MMLNLQIDLYASKLSLKPVANLKAIPGPTFFIIYNQYVMIFLRVRLVLSVKNTDKDCLYIGQVTPVHPLTARGLQR